MSLLFAASHPQRRRTLAHWPASQVEARLDLLEAHVGRRDDAARRGTEQSRRSAFRRAWVRLEQQSASPGAARGLLRLSCAADVGPVLGDIRMPVLALQRRGDRIVGIENARDCRQY
jgi:pimeloyl-ACP methyl ester carboxylesterase